MIEHLKFIWYFVCQLAAHSLKGLIALVSGKSGECPEQISRFEKFFIKEGNVDHGSYGCVYRARCRHTHNVYAVKRIKGRREGAIISMLAEIKRLVGLKHVHIVIYHDSWIEDCNEDEEKLDKLIVGQVVGQNKVSSSNNESSESENEFVKNYKTEEDNFGIEFNAEPSKKSEIMACRSRKSAAPPNSNPTNNSARETKMDYGRVGDQFLYIQMALYDINLEKWYQISKNRDSLMSRIHDWMRQLADAMEYCHRMNITHTDLKPPNIFVKDNALVIGDFGVSIGTEKYASPEQIEMQELTAKLQKAKCDNHEITALREDLRTKTNKVFEEKVTDVFSLGLVFIEMIVNCIERRDLSEEFNHIRGKDNYWKKESKNLPLIINSKLRLLLRDMTNKDPNGRLSFDKVLQRIRALPHPTAQTRSRWFL